MPFNDVPYGPLQLGIRDVPAVPSKQVLAAIDGSDSDMDSIAGRQYGNSSQNLLTTFGKLGVSGAHLLMHEFRHIQIEVHPPRFPPLASDLLVGGDQQITIRASGFGALDLCGRHWTPVSGDSERD